MDKREPGRKRETERKNFGERVETAWLGLKAPVDWFDKLDAWREQQDFTPKPSRPASIRWIVWQYLTKQEQRGAKRRARA
jgi:hypothetical protein